MGTMRVYISGKIGEEVLSEETLEKFKMAEVAMHAMGYEVFNPTRSGLGKKAEVLAERLSKESGRKVEWYDAIMLLDLEELAKCDAICMLADWTESPGATAEFYFAKALGLEFIYKKWDKDE